MSSSEILQKLSYYARGLNADKMANKVRTVFYLFKLNNLTFGEHQFYNMALYMVQHG